LSTKKHFFLGLFFIAAVGVLAWYTLFLTEANLFGGRVEMTAFFPRAHGLRKGDPVHVAGVRWGRVAEVVYDQDARPERRIVVTVSLDQAVRLSEGYAIRIEDATLLGGRVLSIEPGRPDSAAVAADAVLEGEVAPNALEAIDDLVRDNRGALTEAIAGVRDLVGGVREGRGVLGPLFTDDAMGADLRRMVASAADSFENVKSLSDGLRAGQGTLGRLFVEDELYVSLRSIGDDLSAILKDAREGEGLVARLLKDGALADDVAAGVRDLREVIRKINAGEGSLGRFVNDDTIARNVEVFTQRLADGQGTLGRLLADDELYEQIVRIADDLAQITSTVREGRGTLGRLVMDDEMYDELLQAVGLVTRSLEEYREAAPITTFTSVIFGAF